MNGHGRHFATGIAKAGLSGARVDKIAEQSGANKRMIYHYFGGKEQLFAAVVEDAYTNIRSRERMVAVHPERL